MNPPGRPDACLRDDIAQPNAESAPIAFPGAAPAARQPQATQGSDPRTVVWCVEVLKRLARRLQNGAAEGGGDPKPVLGFEPVQTGRDGREEGAVPGFDEDAEQADGF